MAAPSPRVIQVPTWAAVVGRHTPTLRRVAQSLGAVGLQVRIVASLPEGPAEGVAFGAGYVFVGTNQAVWRIPYTSGARGGSAQRVASVRGGRIAPNSDGDVHASTSVAVSGRSGW